MLANYNMTSVTDGGAAGDTDLLYATDFSGASYSMAQMGPDNLFLGFQSGTVAAGGVTTVLYTTAAVATDVNSPGQTFTAFGDQA